MFVDRCEVELIAGDGGDGCLSFRRERYVPKGGPDGGDGGRGGHVIVASQEGVDSLAGLAHRRAWRAPDGGRGEGSNRHGRNGKDLIIEVPVGTVVLDTLEKFVVKDLVEPGDHFIAARGGKGGKGNAHFKSATNQAPRQWTEGEEGERRRLTLELKVIADVGLIGKPNAGKSTLLSRLSRARPEIADYPFTTKLPNLGLVQVGLDRSFVLADTPGLIEGAHAGIGLGHEFLRHIERTGILVHLIEPFPMDGTNPVANYQAIRNELKLHNPSLVKRPEIVVVTKGELPAADEIQRQLNAVVSGEVLLISAVTGQGLNQLIEAICVQLDRVEKETRASLASQPVASNSLGHSRHNPS
ncbi:MAG: GTPase ObgE [Planctomycetota bacterium]